VDRPAAGSGAGKEEGTGSIRWSTAAYGCGGTWKVSPSRRG
jgi:hypothetical protein